MNTSELLHDMLQGQQMIPEQLNDLVTNEVAEDQFLEYKSAKELGKSNSGKTIREYVSGFANSAGGILIFGINENKIPWAVENCTAPNRKDLVVWASDCLNDIAGFLYPPPRFYIVHYNGSTVLVIAVSRSQLLVPYYDKGKPVHKFRIHDKTLSMPEYLVTDLTLGRRNRPNLNVPKIMMRMSRGKTQVPNLFDRISHSPIPGSTLAFQLHFTVENFSFSWAEEVTCGLVGWSYPKDSPVELSSHILSYINLNIDKRASELGSIRHLRVNLSDIAPDQMVSRKFTSFSVPWDFELEKFWDYRWDAAMYVLARNQTPIWYQVCWFLDGQRIRLGATKQDFDMGEKLSIKPTYYDRPVVSWHK